MDKLKPGTYDAGSRDLVFTVLKVSYSNKDYYKVKGVLSYRKTGEIGETKNYKLYKDLISHWKRLETKK